MKYRYLPATIMLLAGAITIITCIINQYDTLYSLKLLLLVLIIFWMIGSLARVLLIRIILMEVNEDAEKNNEKKQDEAEGIAVSADDEEKDI